MLAIEADAVLAGLVYFDGDGSGSIGFADSPLEGVRIHLLARGTIDTVASVTSDAEGAYVVPGLPVGNYEIRVDTATIGDSVQVVRVDTSLVTLAPADSQFVTVIVSFPVRTIEEARAAPPGERFFVEGIALNANGGFGDSTLHVADSAFAIRATNVQRGFVFPGDSVRLLGTRATRDGQPTLDEARAFVVAIVTAPAALDVTSATAAGADGGRLDANLVRVVEATITDTATAGDDFALTVDDGSGPLRVVLDVDLVFTLDPFLPESVTTVTGLLLPDTGGTWLLKPRARQDIAVVTPAQAGPARER